MSADETSLSARYAFVYRNTADGVLIADRDGILRYLNPAACALLGVRADEVLNTPAAHAFRQHIALAGLFLGTGEAQADVRLPRQRLAQGIADTLSTGERIILLQDVTERRDLETRRKALTETIEHALKNRLGSLTGYAELVGRFGDLNDNQKKYLSRISQTTSNLHDSTRSLVNLAWIEAGMPLQHVPVRLDEVIVRVVNELEDLAHKRGVGITTSLQKPLPIVMGDVERLRLAIWHILENAIRYNRPEMSVVVHAWGDLREIYCSIADQGIGIADDELELIFDRMYRSRDERVRDVVGGGLGLTIARTVIRRHGGDIWASSALNSGSTFTFVLPVASQ